MIRIIFYWIKNNQLLLQFISFFISGFLVLTIIYVFIRIQLIKDKPRYFRDVIFSKKNISRSRSLKAWKQIKTRLEINDESNLKLAVIEADKILDEILKLGGYIGDTMSDRLKKINHSQLSNIQEVWQAHKLRNRIVHEPDFRLTRGEAWMAIEIYKKAFQEFGLID